jgi:hypothetical protein
MKPYIHFVCWLARFSEHQHFNRFGAGLHQLLWSHFCGYGWGFAWRMARLYWTPKR